MDDRDQASEQRRVQSARAVRLMEVLDLDEDELCRTLGVDPLTLLSGQIEHRAELDILLTLLGEATSQVPEAVLRRWVRSTGPLGRPLDALLARDFPRFEDQLGELVEHGFTLRGGHDA
jgi:hypothetical protein